MNRAAVVERDGRAGLRHLQFGDQAAASGPKAGRAKAPASSSACLVPPVEVAPRALRPGLLASSMKKDDRSLCAASAPLVGDSGKCHP
jgi:hypothetical protein